MLQTKARGDRTEIGGALPRELRILSIAARADTSRGAGAINPFWYPCLPWLCHLPRPRPPYPCLPLPMGAIAASQPDVFPKQTIG